MLFGSNLTQGCGAPNHFAANGYFTEQTDGFSNGRTPVKLNEGATSLTASLPEAEDEKRAYVSRPYVFLELGNWQRGAFRPGPEEYYPTMAPSSIDLSRSNPESPKVQPISFLPSIFYLPSVYM